MVNRLRAEIRTIPLCNSKPSMRGGGEGVRGV